MSVLEHQASPVTPVTDAEFGAFMASLGPLGPDEAAHPVCIAVSGGGDSMALAVLAQRWRQHIHALVVDHALRAESAAEAELTCQRLTAQGIPATLLTLGRIRPGGVQERAREARFEALEAACVAVGASVLLVAHHAADQEETVWMRLERGSGQRGVCGIAARTVRGRIALLRPLLSVRPERLRAVLQREGVEWCEDPSNQNRRFHRVQIRQDLTEAQRQDVRVAQHEACLAQRQEDAQLAVLLARYVSWQPEGWVLLEAGALDDDAPPVLGGDALSWPDGEGLKRLKAQMLGRLIRVIGGQDYAPSAQALAGLCHAGAGALGRACLAPIAGKQGGWRLYREARNLTERVPAKSGQCWDGRWRYIGPDYAEGYIAALGEAARTVRAGRDVPACVLPSLPALWVGDVCHAVPEAVRGVRADIERAAFVWEGGTPALGERYKPFLEVNSA